MAFLRLDCDFVNSSTWYDRDARDVFLTAMLLAKPAELPDSPQLEPNSDRETGWMLPAGWYGFVPCAVVALVARAGLPAQEGIAALQRLGAPEPLSRSKAYEGRRLIRVDGGFVVLSYMRYREKDHTAAERKRRQRDRQSGSTGVSRRDVTMSRRATPVTSRHVTQAEAEAEAEAPPPTGVGADFALQAPAPKTRKTKSKAPAPGCSDGTWAAVAAAYEAARVLARLPTGWGPRDSATSRAHVARAVRDGAQADEWGPVLESRARAILAGEDPRWSSLEHVARHWERYRQEAAAGARPRRLSAVGPVSYQPDAEDPTPEECERLVAAARGRAGL